MKDIDRDSFVFYRSWYEVLEDEKSEVQWEVIRAVMEYVFHRNLVELKPQAGMAFKFIKRDIDRASEKYNELLEKQKENGKKGGNPNFKKGKSNPYYNTEEDNPKITQDNPTLPKITQDNPNDNDNDNDNDNERETRAPAFEFLKKNFPLDFEKNFALKYQARIKNLKKFQEDFSDTVDLEGLEYEQKKLSARLSKYARNWIENQERYTEKVKKTKEDRDYSNMKL